MSKRDHAAFALALGTGFGWLFLLDTGLAHTPGDASAVLTKGGYVNGASMTPQAVRNVVTHYSERCGFGKLGAHDLRRTFAKLAHKGAPDSTRSN